MLQDYTKKLSCLSESIRRSILEMLRLIKNRITKWPTMCLKKHAALFSTITFETRCKTLCLPLQAKSQLAKIFGKKC